MSQEAGKEMIKQKAGKIINIASIAGLEERTLSIWIQSGTTRVKERSLRSRKI